MIGRDVAFKVIRGEANTDTRARFLREARIQGQLEHPSIVPVYDIGLDDNGSEFFTMKRLRGETLEAILRQQIGHGPATQERFSRGRLLTALVSVCLTIEYAHIRGVVHRDLKPSNIMLGNFGEVYVLDWGIAKILGEAEVAMDGSGSGPNLEVEASLPAVPSSAAASPSQPAAKISLPAGNDAGTLDGSVLGTPGYMSPEQARGELSTLGRAADVYSLGTVLWEILALSPFHDENNVGALMLSTLRGPTLPTCENVPPELLDLILRATALSPEERPTARELADGLERFLDGDRDLERRRSLANVHAQSAAEALDRSAAGDPNAAADATREALAAIALDPSHPQGLTALADSLLDSTAALPPQAEAAFELRRAERRIESSLIGVIAYAAWMLAAPSIVVMGIRSVPAAVVLMTLASLTFLYAVVLRTRRIGNTTFGYGLFVMACVTIGSFSMVFGPFIITPVLLVANSLFFSLHTGRHQPLLHWTTLVTTVVPIVLEWTGVLPPSILFHDGVITILPRLVSFPPLTTHVILVIFTITFAVFPLLLSRRIGNSIEQAERALFVQSWRLKQALPAALNRSETRAPLPSALEIVDLLFPTLGDKIRRKRETPKP